LVEKSHDMVIGLMTGKIAVYGAAAAYAALTQEPITVQDVKRIRALVQATVGPDYGDTVFVDLFQEGLKEISAVVIDRRGHNTPVLRSEVALEKREASRWVQRDRLDTVLRDAGYVCNLASTTTAATAISSRKERKRN
jgi:hypothetical protein